MFSTAYFVWYGCIINYTNHDYNYETIIATVEKCTFSTT